MVRNISRLASQYVKQLMRHPTNHIIVYVLCAPMTWLLLVVGSWSRHWCGCMGSSGPSCVLQRAEQLAQYALAVLFSLASWGAATVAAVVLTAGACYCSRHGVLHACA